MDPGADQATGGVNAPGAEMAPETAVQPAASADQPQGAVESSGLVVGNQSFKTPEELAHAYGELQKGFTRKTQEYSEQLKSYEKLGQWLNTLRADESRWNRFVQAMKQDQGQLTPQKPVQGQQGQVDPMIAQLQQSHEAVKANMEYMEFRQNHADIPKDALDKAVQFVIDKDEQGENWTLEQAHRWLSYEAQSAQAATAFGAGQKQAEAAIAKGKNATVLGSSPTAAQNIAAQRQAQSVKTPFLRMSEAERTKHVGELLNQLGAKFDNP